MPVTTKSDLKTELAWAMFLEQMADIEVGEAFAFQVLAEAKFQCDLLNISMEALVASAAAVAREQH